MAPQATKVYTNFTLRGIPYTIHIEDPMPLGHFGMDSTEVTYPFRTNWTGSNPENPDWDAFRQEVLGYPQGITADGYIQRRTPASLVPDWLYALRVGEIRGMQAKGKSYGDVGKFKEALIPVTFGVPSYLVREDNEITNPADGKPDETQRFTTRHRTPAGEILQMPQGMFFWIDGDGSTRGMPVPYSIGVIIPYSVTVYTWHQVPSIFWFDPSKQMLGIPPNIQYALGKQNKSYWDGHPPGTLLCVGSHIKPTNAANGMQCFDVQYLFRERNSFTKKDGKIVTWNHFVKRTEINGKQSWDWVKLTRDGSLTGKGPYGEYEFANLFKLVDVSG